MKDAHLKELKSATEALKIISDVTESIAAATLEEKKALDAAAQNPVVSVQDEWDSKTWETKESRDFCMDMLSTPEFQAFYDQYYHTELDNPNKYVQGEFEKQWTRHCRDLEQGIIKPLTRQDSEKATLTAGRYRGKDSTGAHVWETQKTIEKASKSGLTAGKYKGKDAAGNDVWGT